MNTAAIVVAAGEGRRIGGCCKALLDLNGRELIRYSLDLFEASELIDGIFAVVHPDFLTRFEKEFAAQWGYRKIIAWVEGGERRQDSVAAALMRVPEEVSLIAVHDAARPLVTEDLLRRLVYSGRAHGAAVPVVEVVDTIKELDAAGRIVRTLPRERLRAVQTPQVFEASLLRRAYRSAAEREIAVTDDASLIEALGHAVAAVEGSIENIKITVPEDMERGELILRRRGLRIKQRQ
ncbi:MAG: 2-C-methyl-D-erythritol 4-phosphate cytidylyltransferase [Candidatus Aureabacteria bacterium]|nr:2-C-methyl-D-erythritol 4-phosphate cytidylyltransferase [Candidatus Auribacterota bacterium]